MYIRLEIMCLGYSLLKINHENSELWYGFIQEGLCPMEHMSEFLGCCAVLMLCHFTDITSLGLFSSMPSQLKHFISLMGGGLVNWAT